MACPAPGIRCNVRPRPPFPTCAVLLQWWTIDINPSTQVSHESLYLCMMCSSCSSVPLALNPQLPCPFLLYSMMVLMHSSWECLIWMYHGWSKPSCTGTAFPPLVIGWGKDLWPSFDQWELEKVCMGLWERFPFLKRKRWTGKKVPPCFWHNANYADVMAGAEAAIVQLWGSDINIPQMVDREVGGIWVTDDMVEPIDYLWTSHLPHRLSTLSIRCLCSLKPLSVGFYVTSAKHISNWYSI